MQYLSALTSEMTMDHSRKESCHTALTEVPSHLIIADLSRNYPLDEQKEGSDGIPPFLMHSFKTDVHLTLSHFTGSDIIPILMCLF